jgi:hypothetical protein
MPSSALQQLDWNLEDVTRLEDAHVELNPQGQGRRALGHITRSALVMLCAGWELYIEDLTQEAVNVICAESTSPNGLPLEIKKKIVNAAKSDKDELAILKLTGEGWKELYKDTARKDAEKLNTPKSEQIGLIFKHFLGIENISSHWTIGPDGVNDIISKRGEIAHRGRDAEYIKLAELQQIKANILQTAIETDNYVATHLKNILRLKKKPWRARTI